jgi:hypothetical protein
MQTSCHEALHNEVASFARLRRAKVLIAIGDKQNTVFFLDASGLVTRSNAIATAGRAPEPSILKGTD